jgi:hypothetical protein
LLHLLRFLAHLKKRKKVDSKERSLNPVGTNGDSVGLSWRGGPADTFSSFALVIHKDDVERQDESYHVLKVVLATGPGRSVYFERIFRRRELRENSSGTVRFELPSWKADAFPLLFSYQYKFWKEFNFTTENVLPLCELGDYFIVPELIEERHKISGRGDLCPDNCHICNDEAILCGNESVLQEVESMCAEHALELINNKVIFHSTPDEFWLRVFQQIKSKSSCSDRNSRELQRSG